MSYGITCTFACAGLALATNEVVDQAVVKWPSGMETVIDNPGIDQYHNVLEARHAWSTSRLNRAPRVSALGRLSHSPPQKVELHMVQRRHDAHDRSVGRRGVFLAWVRRRWLCCLNLLSVTEIVGHRTPSKWMAKTDLCDGSTLR